MHLSPTHLAPVPERVSLRRPLNAARSDARRVEHDAAGTSNRARRQVLAELRAHHAVVAVRPADLAPDDAELGVVDLTLRLVDVSDALAKVKVGVGALVDVLNLDERGVFVLVDLAALVAQDPALAVQAARLTLGLDHSAATW